MKSPMSSMLAGLLSSLVLLAAAAGAGAQSPPADGAPIPPDTLDRLLAPIALYPDALVLQIVQCAGSPFQVKQVSDWLAANPDLKGTAAQQAASQKGFDAEFVAIVLFPSVVRKLADDPDWTRDLGQAFANDRDGVFDSIQRLRTQAQKAGNLQSNDQQSVQTVSAPDGQVNIVIQPANPQVVYVPQYDPNVVYTSPSRNDADRTTAAALVGFAAGVIVGAAADDDDDHYFYACGGWNYRGAALCTAGWHDYDRYRHDMVNDYADHREAMARQAGTNQAARQQAVGQNQANRQSTSSANQAARQETRTTERSTTSENRSSRESSRGDYDANRGGFSSRGAAQNHAQPSSFNSGTRSSAFSGYQRGSSERASSARGSRSMGSRSGGRGGRR